MRSFPAVDFEARRLTPAHVHLARFLLCLPPPPSPPLGHSLIASTGFGCKVSSISVSVSLEIHSVIGLTTCGMAVAVSLVVAGSGVDLVVVAGDDVGWRRML
ncbi:hypothetical protein RHSIM_RhsimUnG0222900 [Rhododendron simsii]|uniref:Uncharacterized protein n=1 Tax=Rhododendron simsii TaxID=118357 RepID=A0A834L3F7_RHOSS|nr:hypothetical protein RHSIM_RhsimUnG0222900 [Rhododendron simsii]